MEPSRDEVVVGDSFSATADHRSEQCLHNLSWSAVGTIELQAAEGTSATFRATAEGTGTITVRNTQGQRGVIEIEVVQPDGT